MHISNVSYMRAYCFLKGAIIMFYKKQVIIQKKETYDIFCVAYVLGIIRKNVPLVTELIFFCVV